jgi:MFS family permease
MKLKKREIRKNDSIIFKELREGLSYTFGFPPIKHIILLLATVSLMGMSYSVLMPVFAKEVLHGGSHTYGFLMGAAGFGALMGAFFLASRKTVLMLGRIVPAAALLFGTGLIILSLTRNSIISVILMVFIGLGMMMQSASSNTILQTITDDNMRGRVMSFYTMAVMGTVPLGSLLAGAMAKVIGTPLTMCAGGVATIAGGLIFLRKLPELQALVHPIYVKMGIIPEMASGIQTASELDPGQ